MIVRCKKTYHYVVNYSSGIWVRCWRVAITTLEESIPELQINKFNRDKRKIYIIYLFCRFDKGKKIAPCVNPFRHDNVCEVQVRNLPHQGIFQWFDLDLKRSVRGETKFSCNYLN